MYLSGTYPAVTVGEGWGDGVLYVGSDVKPGDATIASYRHGAGPCVTEAAPSGQGGVTPVIDVVSLPTLFTAPYTLR